MRKSLKLEVNKFIKKHSLFNPDYTSLKKAAQNIGYTIVEFNNICNDKDIETIIKNLEISDNVLISRGFTYADNNYRLIFINENLNDEEKAIVLSHELGHIVCEHMTRNSIIGTDVKEENEANEFSHYLLKQGSTRKIKQCISRHKKIAIATTCILVFLIVGFFVYQYIDLEQSYYGEYYVTSTGKKYHEEDCIFVKDKTNVERLTKEQFESGEYELCEMCLPD